MNMRDNTAYDYGRFEERSRAQIQEVAVAPKPAKRVGILKAVCCLVVAVLMLSALIYARVEQTELIREYDQYVSETALMAGANAQLQVRIEEMLSPESIAQIAKEEIGLNEIRSQQIEYVEFDSEVKAEVVETKSFWIDLWNNVQNWFRGLTQ